MADVITQFNITEPFGGPFAFIEGGGNPDDAPEVDVGGSLMINVTTGQIVSSGCYGNKRGRRFAFDVRYHPFGDRRCVEHRYRRHSF